MDPKQAAQDFLAKYTELREISFKIKPMDEQIIREDISSAHMAASGVLGEYERLSGERSRLVSELKQIRSEVGDDVISAELSQIEGSEQAREYIQKVPLEGKPKPEARTEIKKGFLGRFR